VREHRLQPTRLVLGIAVLALIAGCAGNGSGGIAPHAPAKPSGAKLQAHVVIHVPKAAGRRHPQFVSPSTQSVAVQVDSDAVTTVDLNPRAPNCTASANGTTCTVAILASPGMHKFAFTTFDEPAGAGNILSANVVTQMISSGAPNLVNVILDGVAAAVVLQVTDGTLVANVAGNGFSAALNATATILATPFDADNNAIIGPGAPVVTASLGTASGGAFSIAPVNGQLNTFTLTTPSAAGSANLAFQLTGATMPIATEALTAALPVINPAAMTITTVTPGRFTFDETGYTGDATESDDCAGIANVTFQTLTSGNVVRSVALGACTITIMDQFGQTAAATVNDVVVPTPPPGAAPIVISPSSLGSADASVPTNVTVSEANYTGPFNEADTCGTNVVTVMPDYGTGPSAVFQVTAPSGVNCVATFTDNQGGSGTLTIKTTVGGIFP